MRATRSPNSIFVQHRMLRTTRCVGIDVKKCKHHSNQSNIKFRCVQIAIVQSLAQLSALLSQRARNVFRPRLGARKWASLPAIAMLEEPSPHVLALLDSLCATISSQDASSVTHELHALHSLLRASEACAARVRSLPSASALLAQLIARVSGASTDSLHAMHALLAVVGDSDLEAQLLNESTIHQTLHLVVGVVTQSSDRALALDACDLLQDILQTYVEY